MAHDVCRKHVNAWMTCEIRVAECGHVGGAAKNYGGSYRHVEASMGVFFVALVQAFLNPSIMWPLTQ